MRKGTTPTVMFALPFDTSEIKYCEVCFAQKDIPILVKDTDECTLSGIYLSVDLTQEETLMFNNKDDLQVQIRFIFTDGTVDATTIFTDKVHKLLKGGTIDAEED